MTIRGIVEDNGCGMTTVYCEIATYTIREDGSWIRLPITNDNRAAQDAARATSRGTFGSVELDWTGQIV